MADDIQPDGAARVQIKLDDDLAEGVYCNLVMIAHSPEEFILDFIRVMPGLPKARVKSRVVVTPQHAKRLLGALHENIGRYEAQFGEISEHDGPPPHLAFGPPGGEA